MNIPKQYLPVMPYLVLKDADALTQKISDKKTGGIKSGEIKIEKALNKLVFENDSQSLGKPSKKRMGLVLVLLIAPENYRFITTPE